MKSRLLSSGRLVLFYSLLSSLIILLIAGILIFQSSGYIRQQILSVKIREKEQLDFYLKEQLVGPVYNELIRDYFSRKWDPILPVFFSEQELTPLQTVQLQRQLQDFVFLHDSVHSVFLLNAANKALLSTYSGATHIHREGILEKFYPFERIKDLNNGWQYFSYDEGSDIMSFFQKVPFSSGKALKGYVVINFDLDYIRSEIRKNFDVSEELVLWKTSLNDYAVLHTGPEIEYKDGLLEDSELSSEFIFAGDGTELVETLVIFSSQGLNSRLMQSLVILIGIGLAAVLGGTFFIGIFTSVMYKPVGEITTTLNAYLPDETKNIDEIKDFLEVLAARSADADLVVEKNKRLNRYKLINDIFSGKSEQIEDHAELTGFPVNGRVLFGTAVKIDPAFSSVLDPAARELLFEQIMLSLDNSIKCIGISTLDTKGVLCSLFSAQDDSSSPGLEQLFTNLQKDVPVPLTMCGGPIDVGFSERIHLGLSYTHVEGYQRYYSTSELGQLESKEYHLSVSEQKRITEWLKSGKTEFVSSFIDDVALRCRERRITVESLLRCENRILELAEETLKEFGVSIEKKSNVLHRYEDYQKRLAEILEQIHNEVVKNKGNQDDLAKRIIRYLEKNVDAQTSIQQVASVFSISTGYLSRLLSTHSSRSFKDIVKSLRLAKAAERLIAEPDLPVSEIVRDLGYSTQAYFSSLFKAQFGFTPREYRKKHIIDVASIWEKDEH